MHTHTRPVRAMFGAAAADLRRPGNALLILSGMILSFGSVLPGFLAYTARADRSGFYDPHYVEHMFIQIGGALAGVAMRGMFRVLAAWLGQTRNERTFAFVTIAVGTAIDLVVMNPRLDLFFDITPLYHASEHGVLFVVNAAVGAAWGTLVGASVWGIILISAAMTAMVAAGGG